MIALSYILLTVFVCVISDSFNPTPSFFCACAIGFWVSPGCSIVTILTLYARGTFQPHVYDIYLHVVSPICVCPLLACRLLPQRGRSETVAAAAAAAAAAEACSPLRAVAAGSAPCVAGGSSDVRRLPASPTVPGAGGAWGGRRRSCSPSTCRVRLPGCLRLRPGRLTASGDVGRVARLVRRPAPRDNSTVRCSVVRVRSRCGLHSCKYQSYGHRLHTCKHSQDIHSIDRPICTLTRTLSKYHCCTHTYTHAFAGQSTYATSYNRK